jgi:hypothetical protein
MKINKKGLFFKLLSQQKELPETTCDLLFLILFYLVGVLGFLFLVYFFSNGIFVYITKKCEQSRVKAR